ncbi:hypothetical protein ACFL0V_06030 [Nanoarchaeota archaeon]
MFLKQLLEDKRLYEFFQEHKSGMSHQAERCSRSGLMRYYHQSRHYCTYSDSCPLQYDSGTSWPYCGIDRIERFLANRRKHDL